MRRFIESVIQRSDNPARETALYFVFVGQSRPLRPQPNPEAADRVTYCEGKWRHRTPELWARPQQPSTSRIMLIGASLEALSLFWNSRQMRYWTRNRR